MKPQKKVLSIFKREQTNQRTFQHPSINVELRQSLLNCVELIKKIAPNIKTLDGKYRITIYTSFIAGSGDLMHGQTLIRKLQQDVPNIKLHWILFYRHNDKDLEKITSFLDKKKLIHIDIHIVNHNNVTHAKKLFSNYPNSLSIICPILSVPIRIGELLPFQKKECIKLSELTYTEDYPLYEGTVRKLGAYFHFGFSKKHGIGLPVTKINEKDILDLNKCVGSSLLPIDQTYYFNYFFKVDKMKLYSSYYQFITGILEETADDYVPTIISNWNDIDVAKKMHCVEFMKELKLMRANIETAHPPKNLSVIEFFKREDNNMFSYQKITLNTDAKRQVIIINPFPLKHEEFISYMKHSHRIVGCTGDFSVSEAIALQKIPFYELGCKCKGLKWLTNCTDHESVKTHINSFPSYKKQIEIFQKHQDIKGDIFNQDAILNAHQTFTEVIKEGLK